MRVLRHPRTLNNEFPIKLSVDGCEAVVPSLICRQHSRQQRDGGYGIAECALPQPPKREHALHVAWLISLEAVDVRWTRLVRQLGGLAKVDRVGFYAANCSVICAVA